MPSPSGARAGRVGGSASHDTVLTLEFNDVIDRPPRWPIQWGAGVVLSVAVLAAVIAAQFQLPETVTAAVSLTTALAPTTVSPKVDGQLDTIFVPEHADVAIGQPLAVIENAARYDDVIKLEAWAARVGALETVSPSATGVPGVPAGLVVGEMQEIYLELSARVREYNETTADTLPRARIGSLARELEQQAALQTVLAAARDAQDSVRMLAVAAADRQRELARGGFSTSAEADVARSNLLQQDVAVHTAEFNLRSAAVRQEDLHNLLLAAMSEHRAALASSWGGLLASFARLRQQIRNWDQSYVIRAPVSGQVTYLEFLTRHSHVRRGGDVIGIVSPDTSVVVEAVLPQANSGRVRAGQPARIELAGFPARDVGYLEGRVADVGLMPRDSLLLVHLRLAHGLRTSFGRRVEFRQRMVGTAEIVTQRISLLRRLLNGARLLTERS
jgi:HlyD family secretion protein